MHAKQGSIVSRLAWGIAATLMFSASAMGQGFNIDFGNAAPGTGSPAATFGAAASQLGIWQTIASVAANTPVVMNGLNGAPTAVTLTCNNANASFGFNNGGTSGNDQLLMDDLLDLGGAGATDTFTIAGLQNGTYDVYTYAWAPDSNTFMTGVDVNGSGVQSVGGAWPAGYVQGTTHAKHTVTIATGVIVIQTSTQSGFSSLNGLQLVIPGPGSLALLGLAGLAGPRRRRA